MSPGAHTVCLNAADVQFPARSTPLGCRAITTQLALPAGNWEGLSAAGPTITVAGWTFDPDDVGRSVPVHVYVDGQNNVIAADRSRPDVGAAYAGAGSSHGFSWSTTVAPGQHLVCAYAIDTDLPWRNTALGCRTITTQLALPRANWDVLSASGSTISVSGWTFDPDDGGRSVPVHVYVDGQNNVIAADRSRPDVGAAFSGAGDSHGFSWSTTVAPGDHRVCAYAIDTDLPWRNTALGCRTVSTQMALPRANWDTAAAVGPVVMVSGWAFDPDGGTVPVHIYVDGRNNVIDAVGSRPDVAAAFGVGSSNGFSLSTTVLPGTHTVCVYAIDAQFGDRNTPLGCRSITTQMALPTANWDVLSASGSTISVSGWTFDPDDGGRSVPVHVYVDGQNNVIAADRSRPDVGAAFSGAGDSHGFSWSTTVAPGDHRVCAYAIDTDLPWRNTALGCRTVSTQMALPRANWDGLTASGSTLSVSGWAFDPDDVTAAVPVHVYVDGHGTPVTANAARPDVGAAFGVGDAHGLAWSAPVTAGEHQVCLYVIDAEVPSRNTSLGCRSITL